MLKRGPGKDAFGGWPLRRSKNDAGVAMRDPSGDRGEMGIEGVAVIGIAIRFPGANTPGKLWKNLCDGAESITFFSDEQLDPSVPSALKQDPAYVKARGVIDGADMFDASFFNISPREAQIMDPQVRLFMEISWAALEDACYVPGEFNGLIGVFGGTGFNSYFVNHVIPNSELVELFGSHAVFLANAPDYMTTRVSYKMDLRGPSISIYTGCSTSLVAVSQAFDSLQSYQCDLAIAGGSFVQCPLNTGYLYQEGEIFSPDGHCRAFDEKAGGTVFSDGAGVVVLKRLDEAIRDNDHIYAVIKGVALNNDGSDKVSFTAPSVSGQAGVISQAHANAGINPECIVYHEAHGTGTRLGDPIEIEALEKAFRLRTSKEHFCAIGSIKANIGHLDATAGIAGLIKAVMILVHKKIPPSINYDIPNPQIDFINSPFYVNSQIVDLDSSPKPLLASVSSFGVGGTNAHIVIEEAPERKPRKRMDSWNIIPVSAKTKRSLVEYVHQIEDFLKQSEDLSLADVAHSCQIGRKAFKHKSYVVCKDISDAIQKMGSFDPRGVEDQTKQSDLHGVIFMFTGQGAQHVGMGKELYLSEPVFKRTVDDCAELLFPSLGFDVRRVIYPEGEITEEVERQVNQTAVAQPALFVIEYALAKLLHSWGARPTAMVGHSIGEYVAACLAGVFDLKSALVIVGARGRLMQEMEPGAMLAVAVSEARIGQFLNDKVTLAAVNAPEMCVISGEFDAIRKIEERLGKEKIGHKRLVTSHAFHSPMMDSAARRFEKELGGYELRQPQLPFLSNVSGALITKEQATSPGYWADQLRMAVRFHHCLETLVKDGNRVFVEVGPGNTLCTLAKQNPGLAKDSWIIPTLRRPLEKRSNSEFILNCLGQLWSAGVEIDWHGFNRHREGRRIPLPTYPFERNRYWIEAAGVDGHKNQTAPVASLTEAIREQEKKGQEDLPSPFNSETEKRLADIWKDLLSIASIKPADNYFELGGSSLFAVRMFDQIERVFNMRLPMATLYEAPTLRELADRLGASERARDWSSIVEINKGSPEKHPLFLIHSEGGNVLEYWPLSKYFSPDQPIYALQAKGLEGQEIIDQSVEEMAESFLLDIKSVQQSGPYYLGGYCLGGLVAYEMSKRLSEEGEKVNFLAMISTRTPVYINKSSSNAGLLRRFVGRLVEIVNMEAHNLSVLKWPKKWNYLRERVMRLHNLIQVNSERAIDMLLRKIGIEANWHSRDYVLHRSVLNQRDAFYGYRPSPCEISAVLFRVKNNPRFFVKDETLGWSQLIKGDLKIFEVDAFHKNIMKEPNIEMVGEKLRGMLASAQADAKKQ